MGFGDDLRNRQAEAASRNLLLDRVRAAEEPREELRAVGDGNPPGACGPATIKPETVGGVAGAGYCIEAVVGSHRAVVNGPGGTVLTDTDTGFANCA